MARQTLWEHRGTDVACGLDASQQGGRTGEWTDLRCRWGRSVDGLPGGVRLHLEPGSEQAARDLVEREADCCPFLDFAMVVDATSVRLDITSPSDAGARIARLLAGVDEGSDDLRC